MKNNIYNHFVLNFLFCFFPISLIIGNQATNLATIILSLYTLIIFNKQIFRINFSKTDKILFLFFFYLIFTLAINYIEHLLNEKVLPKIIIIKTFFFFKYFFLYLVLRFLIFKKIIKLEIFNYVCALCVIIVSADILIQFLTGKNFFGSVPVSSRHYSGFFGEELIAGGYIQKFSLFALFLCIASFFKHKHFFKILILIILFLVFLFSIILSGNRLPLILFLLSISLIMIFDKYLRKIFLIFVVSIFLFLLLVFEVNSSFKINMQNFYYNGKNLISTLFDSNLKNKDKALWQKPYVTEFYCGKTIAKLNPFFGGGLRSYRTYSGGCNSHPHNYYLEIISDLGIVGLMLILFFLFKLLNESFKNLKYRYAYFNQDYINLCPAFFIILMEIFPLRTSGSFFTTNNATLMFILFAILASSIKNNKIHQ